MYNNKFFRTREEAKAFQQEHGGAMEKFKYAEYKAALRTTRAPAHREVLRRLIERDEGLSQRERDLLLRQADRQEARR